MLDALPTLEETAADARKEVGFAAARVDPRLADVLLDFARLDV